MNSKKFLGRNPAIGKWSESDIQCYIVQEARRAGYVVTACMEQGKRSPAGAGRAKAMGMTAGVPDLLFWLGSGVCLIELKTDKGRLSPAQNFFHGVLTNLKYVVHTVYAATPVEAYEKVLSILTQRNIQ